MSQIINLRENRDLFDIYYDTTTYQHVLYSAQLGIYLHNEQIASEDKTHMYIGPFAHNQYTCRLCNDDLIQETRFKLCNMHYNEQCTQQNLIGFK
jgi:hypothetical protein